jgi:phosphoribosylamine--glycine ligase
LKQTFNILLLGSGGREHAFAWKMSQSKHLGKLYIAPGNAGTPAYGTNVNIDPLDFEAVKAFVRENGIHMVVVGPEAPLVAGIHDFFLNDSVLRYIPVIGPQKEGAQLEGSKDFSKAFMQRHNIPTAAYNSFTAETLSEGLQFLDTLESPYVLKADGLAAGKGVIICEDVVEAKLELTEMLMEEKFGEASRKVVIEEFLHGIELSVFVLSDGVNYKILPAAKDYKRVGEGDTGLNTGGMGAISPVPFATEDFLKKVEERVVIPTVKGLKKDNIPYTGFIFIGLMNVDGEPFVIEYNCRMGDPETEVVIPRIKTDLLELFEGVANQTLDEVNLEIEDNTAVTVMLVADGYPGNYEKGKVITGLDEVEDSLVFHAGTKLQNGQAVTNGGRIMAVTSVGANMNNALGKSYRNIRVIDYEGKYYRKDIGFDLREDVMEEQD